LALSTGVERASAPPRKLDLKLAARMATTNGVEAAPLAKRAGVEHDFAKAAETAVEAATVHRPAATSAPHDKTRRGSPR
jgi:hypothetical protein